MEPRLEIQCQMTVSPALQAVIGIERLGTAKPVIFSWYFKKVIDIKCCLELQTSDLQMTFNEKSFTSIDIK